MTCESHLARKIARIMMKHRAVTNNNYDIALAPGLALTFFGSVLVLFTCPITTRRLVVDTDRLEQDFEQGSEQDSEQDQVISSLRLQAQIRELTERLNRIENGQHRETSAHEIIYLGRR
ncbi:17896_t:CDS:2 [Funneliformis caledonium]|uniref:17896_t:CDS:1 n=1 Tax=Funneliformis caledonium TaxID=1117310 RepID=A0A9N9G179_9GLOM|nr:17896_t:CDS:2 [Funneliformis caledonium]